MSEDVIQANLEHWKRRLLDLTRRNRLLNFKPSKTMTIVIVGELPTHVFKTLAVEERAMRFGPADVDADEADTLSDDDALQDFELNAGTMSDPLASDRQTDLILETRLSAAKLDHKLRRIADQAASVLEEQGIHTLFLTLGMLHWYDSDDSAELRRAPILLLPVTLARRSAGGEYKVSAADEDPIVNPALVEYLRASFGITLPDLPEITEDYDPTSLYADIAQRIATRPRWKVTNEIVLGLFSFQKFVLFKDLEKHRAAYLGHRLIRQLVTRKGGSGFGLPDSVASIDLDESFPAETTFQVVDADSTQVRAVAAVAKGHDVVLQGPPGTGKSQTIANLIAHALGTGKTVLFVSEKMAALQVVFSRLKAIGLGEFCLELHGPKSNKRAVMAEIARSLDSSLVASAGLEVDVERLRAVRAKVSDYASALHTPHMPLGLTPYQAYGRLSTLADAPPIRLRDPIDTVSAAQLAEARRDIDELAVAAATVVDPARHPWRDTTCAYYSSDLRTDLEDHLDRLCEECQTFNALAPQVAHELGLPHLVTLADAERAASVASVIERSPGATCEVLQSEAWNSPPPKALELLELGVRATEGQARALARFHPDVLDRDHTDDASVIDRLHRKVYRMLIGDFRRIRKTWLGWRAPGYAGTLAQQSAHMREVDQVRQDLRALTEASDAARQLFGTLWQEEDSDWDSLRRYVEWVVDFRSLCISHGLKAEAAHLASLASPDVASSRNLAECANRIAKRLEALRRSVGWPDGYLRDAPVAEIAARVSSIRSDFGRYTEWISLHSARAAVAAGVGGEALREAETNRIPYADLNRAFERAFLRRWLDTLVPQRPALLEFHVVTHEQRVTEFRRLDRAMLRDNRTAVIATQRRRAQQRLRELRDSDGMRFLRGQLTRQRGLAPLRRTLLHAHEPVKAIKPCFMMSPLTVAQFLNPQDHVFDLVVFDEAIQLTAEDAVGAVVRGKQLVVVGDPKQLPPTNFFAVQSGQVEAQRDETGEPLVEDMESILEQFMAAGLPAARLRWHYRSRHESLITFSNLNFYDSELYTFPSSDTDTRERGLQFVYVEDGVYEGAGLNRAEASRVADAVVEFAREQLAKPDEQERLTLGVGTFNLRQQIAVQDELERRRRQDPDLEPFFAPCDEGGFFVKNLENIQGDDRDVIFLSVTYAKGLDGRMRHNFGPINGENGWRRLNVLTTRARLRMRVFSSMHAHDIDLSRTQAAGSKYLKGFLAFAEHGELVGETIAAGAKTESPFEYGVFQELTRLGFDVIPQVGVAGYRIDLGIRDKEVPGRFICGVECDGVAYHSAESARDRDRLRQEVLEGLGWTLHRVWSTDWFKDRDGTVRRLVEKIRTSQRLAREPRPAPQKAQGSLTAVRSGGAFVIPMKEPQHIDGAPRPVTAEPYRMCELGRRGNGSGVLATSTDELAKAIGEVARIESPVHEDDIMMRVSTAFGDEKVGSRIARDLASALVLAERRGFIVRRKGFVWLPDGEARPRSRAGTNIPGERIAPEEYEAAALTMLRAGTRPRKDLVVATRMLLGFNRTGWKLEERIGEAIDYLVRAGRIGEASTGLSIVDAALEAGQGADRSRGSSSLSGAESPVKRS